MRKSLWIILAIMLVAIVAPNAHADSFTATFTCSGTCVGGLPTAPDVSFPAPVVDVTWNDNTFPLTLPSSDLPTDSYVWDAHAFLGFNGELDMEFGIMDITTGMNTALSIMASGFFADLEGGPLAFAAVATPEPSSYALMLLGVGLVFVMRKRIGQGLPQAS